MNPVGCKPRADAFDIGAGVGIDINVQRFFKGTRVIPLPLFLEIALPHCDRQKILAGTDLLCRSFYLTNYFQYGIVYKLSKRRFEKNHLWD